MVRKVIWSWRAQNDRKEIFNYWNKHNKSNTYSKKLDMLFRKAIQLIKEHPGIGKPTDDEKSRVKIVRNYLIIYELVDEIINIQTIWDARQDTDKLKEILK